MGAKIVLSTLSSLSGKGIVLDDGQRRALEALKLLDITITKKWNPFSKKKMGVGVYLYGDVGRGKTMVMDAFFETVPDTTPKMRIHFHAFMKQAHEFLHEYRQNNKHEKGVDKALPQFVEGLAKDVRLICFDEFHITDVADAMILSRLFTAVLERGVSVVMTSNWAPDHLYEGGLQRDRIVPFIDLIKRQMNVVELDGDIDYRKLVLKGRPVYFTTPYEGFEKVFCALTQGKERSTHVLEIKGRKLVVSGVYGDVATLTFDDLCAKPLGAQDYMALARAFNVVIIEEIPELSAENRNEAKRFVTLIDILYEEKVAVVITAAQLPDNLYSGSDHAFEFDRTISRLIEMQGKEYLAATLQPKY